MTKRVIHVGIGSFGRRWCTEFLAANIADRTIEVVAVVDVDPQALKFGAAALGLPDNKCYVDIAKAFWGEPGGLLHHRRAARPP